MYLTVTEHSVQQPAAPAVSQACDSSGGTKLAFYNLMPRSRHHRRIHEAVHLTAFWCSEISICIKFQPPNSPQTHNPTTNVVERKTSGFYHEV